MASIKILLKNKSSSDGQYPIILRIIKDRKTKRISLGMNCLKKDWDESNFQFKKSQNNYIQRNRVLLKLKAKALKIIDDFNLDEIDFTLNQFEEKFKGKNLSKVTVSEFWLELIEDQIKAGRTGNAKVHKNTYSSFYSFRSNKTILFKEITTGFLEKYETHLRARGCQDGGIAVRMREIRALFNDAIKKGIVDEKHYPFKAYKVSKLKGKGIKKALTRDEMKLMETINTDKFPHLINAKNYMIFSYYMGGMNFVDLLKLRWGNVQGDRILYIRSKTKGRFTVKILKPVQKVLDFYKAQNRMASYVFPILLKENLTPMQIENRKHKTLKKFNKDLKEIAEIQGVQQNVTSYVIRHSFATNLKFAGISTDLIGESMGHHDVSVTKAYLKEFEDDVIDDAMKKLLEEPMLYLSDGIRQIA